MAEEVGSAATKAAGRAAGRAVLKGFMSPSIDIIKTIPQGIIELSLRGAAVVSAHSATKNSTNMYNVPVAQLESLINQRIQFAELELISYGKVWSRRSD